MLKFFGRASAFETPQNSAFFIDDTNLVLLDCPMSTFHILKDSFDDISDKKIQRITVLVTHTHGDHICGIPMLIHYCFFILHIPVVVAAPSREVKEDLYFYLNRMEGCNPSGYSLITADTLTSFVKDVIPTTHTQELEGRCFGYHINIEGNDIIYTGDTNTLEPFKKYLEPDNNAEDLKHSISFYTEAASVKSPVHIYINEVLDYLSELPFKGINVYLMHMDNEEIIKELIKDTNIKLAPLFNSKENAMSKSDTMLNDIFTLTEKLYSDMNSPGGGDHNTIFKHLTELGKTLTESDRASFWKWDKVNHTLWTTAATGTDRITIPDSTGLVGKALSEGKILITNDPYNNPYFNSDVDKKTGYVTKSILVMPVANINGEYIGAYQVINKLSDDGKFSEAEDCKKLSLAALICGLALESDVFLEESYTDKLTKLKNRMGFFADFKKTYNAIINDPNRQLSLFICDIDKFKSVNDTYGHNAGDEVLKHVAQLMMENTRESDGMYRWGGEEFIMIMADADMEVARQKAEDIRKQIEASVCEAYGYTIRHTMSFGVTEFDSAKSIEENISVADEKLYTAKESGRNRVIA